MLAQTLCVSNSELCICFYGVCLFETFLLSSRGKTQGHFASRLWPLLVWQQGLLVLIRAPHIQFRTAHCCLRDHLVLKPEIREFKVCIKTTLGWTWSKGVSMDMSLSNSGSWWWTGGPGELQSMGSQIVGHHWVTELNWDREDNVLCGQDSLRLH